MKVSSALEILLHITTHEKTEFLFLYSFTPATVYGQRRNSLSFTCPFDSHTTYIQPISLNGKVPEAFLIRRKRPMRKRRPR